MLDELTGTAIGEDVLRRIEKAYDDIRADLPHVSALVQTSLIGFYELGDLNVPVFDHAKDVWDELITAELARRATGTRARNDLFDHLPIPRPVKGDVDAVVEFVRSHEVEPPLVEIRSVLSVRGVAQGLLAAGAISEVDKVGRLHDLYESSIARSEYLTFQAFWEAVQQQILGLARPDAELVDPEAIPLRPAGSPLPGRTKRELEPLLGAAAANGRSLMTQFGEADCARRLAPDLLPDVSWTRRPVKGSFAYWRRESAGRPRVSRSSGST